MALSPPWVFPELDAGAAGAARARQDTLTKPRGSLGALEDLAVALAGIQGGPPASRPAAAVLFAADHPVARHGVSAYPAEVTAAMVANFVRGGAASSVLCRHLGVELRVVDVGVAHPYERAGGAGARLRRDPVADDPIGDLRVEDALSEDVYERALRAGAAEIDALGGDTRVVLLGEMGIGNTTAASAMAALLLGLAPEDVVGAGTGVAGDALSRKVEVVRDATRRVQAASSAFRADPRRVVLAVGGKEIAALVGAMARAIERRMAVLVDGFIVSTAALALVRMDARARAGMLFAHRSAERGHAHVLAALEARPLLDLGMRLGEASAALAALPLLDAACALHAGMATFASASVPDRAPPGTP
ncbi:MULTISPECIES: nicotinate-nucleotide--dimethylbenzimidazole phosphoribosyltransferase [Sorangium]|uniref:Nicotinate-nucleotide--dimethylbenzimidazole phosphoribosyltransferase n=1 Tax=Sorangium cellulosum TaxID=56 RepID=A0A4P2QZX2_SORCE|nr:MULTISPECIES: nicotinate-nucleotide--dimethylbenzimidazole phosphoribosyltransferase [Sorangium]AUX36187.1 nicotinate-nucleotide--dimethylbenzimidazole phosphoribosyltransferase [Sorangium cellulosum]WCQ95489.1 Nicotinate-nucleotide--dimethylbenzimidazole phosphoribosyltransferase [Sorangium sp. Soce836]